MVEVGDRVIIAKEKATVRYVGEVVGQTGALHSSEANCACDVLSWPLDRKHIHAILKGMF